MSMNNCPHNWVKNEEGVTFCTLCKHKMEGFGWGINPFDERDYI